MRAVVYAVNLVNVATLALGLGLSSLAVAEEASSEEARTTPESGTTQYVLAVSWQPGFCETRPTRKECVDQTSDRFDATHFSLLCLWPLRQSYCGVEAELKRKTARAIGSTQTKPPRASSSPSRG